MRKPILFIYVFGSLSIYKLISFSLSSVKAHSVLLPLIEAAETQRANKQKIFELRDYATIPELEAISSPNENHIK